MPPKKGQAAGAKCGILLTQPAPRVGASMRALAPPCGRKHACSGLGIVGLSRTTPGFAAGEAADNLAAMNYVHGLDGYSFASESVVPMGDSPPSLPRSRYRGVHPASRSCPYASS